MSDNDNFRDGSRPLKLKRGVKQMVAEANREIVTVPVAGAKELVGNDGVVFVDLRDPRELEREGKIPGAFHCPRGMLEFWVDPESPYHKPVFSSGKQLVFYCQSGWRSALSAKTVQDMGLGNVAHVGGGFTTWKAEGGPVEEVKAKKD
jgi:rhodanese-related sulfurtransferase